MIVLIPNLGSTSFKYKLFDFRNEADTAPRVLAVGSADRIGQNKSAWSVRIGDHTENGVIDLADHAAAIDLHLDKLLEHNAITSIDQIKALGFKAAHGGPIIGTVLVDEKVIDTMQEFADVAPAHNPPYIAAMRAFAEKLPSVPQVAAFETGFHQTIPLSRQVYGVPYAWIEELGIRRYGFHGASHRYIATCMGQIAPDVKKIISLHLGGSCSINAIRDGKSMANSLGMTCQSGVFHNNRVGDLDVFALVKLQRKGLDLDTILAQLGKDAGLKGLSGVSADMREVEKAADAGNQRAKLAIDAFVDACRNYLGAYLAILNGVDAIVFTAGIGQHGAALRAAICSDLDYAGIHIDAERNRSAAGDTESQINSAASGVQIWVVPTNEELIVAQQTVAVLKSNRQKSGKQESRKTGRVGGHV